MRRLKYLSVIFTFAVLILSGCMEEDKIVTPSEDNLNNNNQRCLC